MKWNTALEPEEYILDLRTAPGKLSAGSIAGLWNGAALFLDYAGSSKAVFDGKGFTLPALLISDKPDLKYRAIDFQWCYTLPTLELMKRTVRTMRALRMNSIVPEFGSRLMWTSDKSALPHSTAREFLRECAAHGLLVIPKINSLGHSDRGFPWPDKLGSGLDFGSERNYAALEAEIAAWKKELADADLPFVYFHFGMDEASDCLRKNVKKYKKSGAELVAAHMNRIAALCNKYNITGIIYHDMLVGKNEPNNWREMGTMHADADKSYLARKKIARSLVLNYWNYEGFNRYRTLDGLHDEGFSVFFTPWGGSSVRNMARNAALYGEGLIGSTWCDWHLLKNGTIPPNSIFNRLWIRAVELTMTMPDAPGLLQKNRQRFGDDLVIGMGTVVNAETAQQALDHGAQFLVSPFPVPAALPLAKAQAIPMVMGAFSPLEVFTVYHLGADFVKVFPLNVLGMNYLKDLKGPLPGVKFFPTGGITLEQIPALFKLGVAGCGVGGSLVRTDLIAENNWEELYSLARCFLEAIPERSQSK